MKTIAFVAPLAAIFLASTPVMAAQGATSTYASIPFANHHGVRNWVAQGNDTIYFEDNFGRWYRAVLFAPSMDLGFTNAIGIDSGPMGTLDKWSAVIVRGQRYPFQSFERVDGPPARPGKAKAGQQAQPATRQ